MRMPHTPSILAALTILGLLCTAALGAPTQDAQPHSKQHPALVVPSSDGGGNEGGNRTVTRYLLDPDGLAEEAARTGTLTVTAMEGEQLSLLLTEFDMMVRKSYIDQDANGTLVSKPYLGRTFNGNLATDPGSRAFLLISPNGLYGSVTSQGTLWSFQPMREQPPSVDGRIVQEVSAYAPTPHSPTLSSPVLLRPTGAQAGSSSLQVAPGPDLTEETSSEGPDGYSFCAWEGDWCAFSGRTMDVAYGADGSYFFRAEVSGGINCTNTAFGDPIPYTYKACYIKESASSQANREASGTSKKTSNPNAEGTPAEYDPSPQSEAPAGYVFCASEDDYCGGFSGAKTIAYGAKGHFSYKTGVTGGIGCTNANFGDPIPYTSKACYTYENVSPDGGPNGYLFCTTEGNYCNFSGTRDVAYGANGAYYFQQGVTGGISCTNSVFGDPNYGVYKACYTYDGAAGSAPCGSPSHAGYCGLYVKPFADLAYVQYANDWYDRIVAAYGEGVEMWQDETNIQLWIYEPENILVNFEAIPGKCKYNDGGMTHFQSHIETNGLRFTGPNSYALFEAHTDMGTDGVSSEGVAGCGKVNALSDHDTGFQEPNSVYVVNAKQWGHMDSWVPEHSWALGMPASHELTHNAGEDDHPTDGDCNGWGGRENLMNNGIPYFCLDYWRAGSTIQKVKTFSYPKLS